MRVYLHKIGLQMRNTALQVRYLSASLLIFLSASCSASVGYQQITVPDPAGRPLLVSVWYPSRGTGAAQQIGLFTQTVIAGGPVLGSSMPLILFSHGTGGSPANYYDTALALARSGFVVAAVLHTADNYRDQRYAGDIKDLMDRPRQVHVVLDCMLSSWPAHSQLDAQRIGMFGHSLGGFTTLVEIGGTPHLRRLRDLCSRRAAAPECLFVKQRHGDQLNPRPPGEHLIWVHDARIKAALVAAPALSVRFGPGDLDSVRIPVQVWRAAKDDQVPDEWNTALLRHELPHAAPERVVKGAGHFDFMAPCTAALQQQIPSICRDPEGFNRGASLKLFNREVVRFFLRNLIAPPRLGPRGK